MEVVVEVVVDLRIMALVEVEEVVEVMVNRCSKFPPSSCLCRCTSELRPAE